VWLLTVLTIRNGSVEMEQRGTQYYHVRIWETGSLTSHEIETQWNAGSISQWSGYRT